MSEKLCTLRTQGGGGGAKVIETVLWTNPSPSSNFSAQTVTLSDSIDNYDYIKVNYNYSASSSSQYSDIRPVSVFKQGVYPQQDYTPLMSLGCYAGNVATARGVMYASATTVRFSPANNVASTGSADNRAIPTAIIGIKNMGDIRTNEKYDYVPFTDMAGGQTLTWNTKGRAKAVWIIMGVNNGADYIRTNVNPSTGEIDNDTIYYYNDSASGASPTIQSGVSITITDNTVSTNAFSGSTRRFALIYTY